MIKENFVLSRVVVFLITVAAMAQSGPEPRLWGGLARGPFNVGFGVVHLTDPSRYYGAEAKRPIQVSLWYPVQKSAQPLGMPFSEYVALYQRLRTGRNGELSTTDRTDILAAYGKETFPGSPPAAVAQLLATPTAAVRDARPAEGRFPLVVYAPGLGGTPLTHTPVAEYLASHGYVVAMSPSQGDSPAGMPFDVAGQEQQIRDIEFTIGALREQPNVDPWQIGLVGFSFGGGAVILSGMRIPGIRAVAVLDGTGGWDATLPLLREATGFHPAAFRAPLLVLAGDDEVAQDLSLIHSLKCSDRQVIRIRAMRHHDFIASPIISAVVTGNVAESAARGFPFTAQTLLRFFDGHLQGVRSDMEKAFKLPPEGAARPGEPSSQITLPRIAAPSGDELVTSVLEKGDIDSLTAAQAAFARKAPGMPLLSEGTMRMLALWFLDHGKKDKAVTALQLLVDYYPRDVQMLNMLGDLYLERHEEAKAEQCFRASLAALPGNGGAKDGLKKLERIGH